ncbi:MAG TPA: amidohydrolase [Acidimicrobiia bacterium]|nr:amidohydrolase [Acidimicrobiia bacterium]
MSLTVRDARLDDAVVAVRVEEDRIVAIGAEVESADGDEVLDAAGMALVPGLVNGHTHAAMTLMRGYGGDLPLMQWLQDRIFPIEAKLTADDVYWGTRLACVEMIRSGTVRFWDMYWQPEAVARAVQDAGIRASVALPLVDGLDAGKSDALRADAERSLDALADAGPRITPTLGPHSIYLVSEKSLHWIAELSSDRDLRVHIHLSETEGEVQDCVAAHGVRPAPYLDRIGLLTPRTLLAHGVWFDDDELALVGERGATIVTNPVSNLKLAVGRVFPYAKARHEGIPVGLGTDGASSNNSLDLFQDMKHLALVQKHAERDPAAMPATEAWAVATGQRAPVLGQPGRLEAGEPADFLLVPSDAPELTPGDLIANLVYAAAGSVVDTTVVAGQVLMRGGEIGDEAEVRAGAIASARRLGVIE